MTDSDEAELLRRVRDLTGSEFETFVASLWELQGWTAEITEASGDGGRDILAERYLPYEASIKIEAKGWNKSNHISAPTIRQYALLPGDDVDHAVVVTSSSFTEPAKLAASEHDIKLVDSSRLAQLIKTLDAEDLLSDDHAVSDWEDAGPENRPDWPAINIWEEDSVDLVSGIGPARAETLAAAGIRTLGDLLSADVDRLVKQTPFAESRLQRWSNLAAFHKGGQRPDTIDAVDSEAVTKLAEADIYTLTDLEAACPKQIAGQTEFSEETLKRLVGDAVRQNVDQVTEVEEIGSERAKELAKVGIFSVSEFAKAEPEDVAGRTDLTERLLQGRIEHVRSNRT